MQLEQSEQNKMTFVAGSARTFEHEIHGLLCPDVRAVPHMHVLRRDAERCDGSARPDELRVIVRPNERAAAEGTCW
jgi:hypothetical protein